MLLVLGVSCPSLTVAHSNASALQGRAFDPPVVVSCEPGYFVDRLTGQDTASLSCLDGAWQPAVTCTLLEPTSGVVASHQKIDTAQGEFTGVLGSEDHFGISTCSTGTHRDPRLSTNPVRTELLNPQILNKYICF